MKNNSFVSLSVAIATGIFITGCATGGNKNPVDIASNPSKLDYLDVIAKRPDFKEPFLRDGVRTPAQKFSQIAPGLPQAQVQNILGQPLQVNQGAKGTEWEYNFKFQLPQSENYLVCQYKVVFDTKQLVQQASWRRKQCLDISKLA